VIKPRFKLCLNGSKKGFYIGVRTHNPVPCIHKQEQEQQTSDWANIDWCSVNIKLLYYGLGPGTRVVLLHLLSWTELKLQLNRFINGSLNTMQDCLELKGIPYNYFKCYVGHYHHDCTAPRYSDLVPWSRGEWVSSDSLVDLTSQVVAQNSFLSLHSHP
jgi:hypothetical protein